MNSAFDNSRSKGRAAWLRQMAGLIADIEVYWLRPEERENPDWFPNILYYEADVEEIEQYRRSLKKDDDDKDDDNYSDGDDDSDDDDDDDDGDNEGDDEKDKEDKKSKAKTENGLEEIIQTKLNAMEERLAKRTDELQRKEEELVALMRNLTKMLGDTLGVPAGVPAGASVTQAQDPAVLL